MWNILLNRGLKICFCIWIICLCINGNIQDADDRTETSGGHVEEEVELSTEHTQRSTEHTERSTEHTERSSEHLFHHADESEVDLDQDYNQDFLDTLPPDFYITYPKQIRRNEELELDTRDYKSRHKNDHYEHTAILLKIFDKRYKIKLDLNEELLSKGLKVKQNIDGKTSIIEERSVEECYYQGQVRRVDSSSVVLSTCHGIRGVIQINNVTYIIHPLQRHPKFNDTKVPHVVYKTQMADRYRCANERGFWEPYQDLHSADFLRHIKIMKSNRESWDVLPETKFIDLALVLDSAMLLLYNDSITRALHETILLANIIDSYYRRLDIRITLVLVEIWENDDMFYISPNPRETLHSFMTHRQTALRTVNPDIAQFVSGKSFHETELGMSIPDSICSDRAVGVTSLTSFEDVTQVAAAVSHMIAHNLGAHHDHNHPCTCEDGFGCIMDELPLGVHEVHPNKFDQCSQKALNGSMLAGLGDCLIKHVESSIEQEAVDVAFKQVCGNGIVERGEECDCFSEEDCLVREPCCDYNTCLLKPWATCREGECCQNCTVSPSTRICRLPWTECDVPEYCDGITGQCPPDAHYLDGEPCRKDSYCYKGLCHTSSDQCQAIWGPSSVPGETKCYEQLNTKGNVIGHCGYNETKGTYEKCLPQNVRCGLLHCAHGDDVPRVGKQFTASITNFVTEDEKYLCRVLNGQSQADYEIGMVEDGTQCGDGSVCVNRNCLEVASFVTGACVKGINNLTCSGNGICTSEFKCFCTQGYSGADCSVQTTTESTTMEQTTEQPNRTDAGIVGGIIVKTTTVLTTTATEPPVMTLFGFKNWTTMWLVIVLASVAGAACLVLACCMICYRRRSPKQLLRKKKKKHKVQLFGSMNFTPSSTPSKAESGSEDNGPSGPRLISFGNLPSYRADKLRKALRKSMGEHSETASEHSRSERDSMEVKPPVTLPEIPPEKGILKKYPRSEENLRKICPNRRLEMIPLRAMGRNENSPIFGRRLNKKNGSVRSLPNHPYGPPTSTPDRDCEERLVLMQNMDHREAQSNDEYETIGSPYDEECNSCASDCSCSSIDKKDFSESDLSDDDRGHSTDAQTQTDHESANEATPLKPRPTSKEISENNRILKLKNINDLLKQIDEQFNSVLKQTTEVDLSPANSDDMRCSETEADRQYRNSFYKQSDLEEGYSPPHRSPVLSPNPPSTLQGTDPSSSLISSPSPLPSPSCVLSPESSSHQISEIIHDPMSSPDSILSPTLTSPSSSSFSLPPVPARPVYTSDNRSPLVSTYGAARRISPPRQLSRQPCRSVPYTGNNYNGRSKSNRPLYQSPKTSTSSSTDSNTQTYAQKHNLPEFKLPRKDGGPYTPEASPKGSPVKKEPVPRMNSEKSPSVTPQRRESPIVTPQRRESPPQRRESPNVTPQRRESPPSQYNHLDSPLTPTNPLSSPKPTPALRLDTEIANARRSPSQLSPLARTRSSPNSQGQVSPPILQGAIPYRGAKIASPPLHRSPAVTPNAVNGARSPGTCPDVRPSHESPLTKDDDKIIIREIPKKPINLSYTVQPRVSKEISSPEDVNV